MADSTDKLAALRRRIAATERRGDRAACVPLVPLGPVAIDEMLSGGLQRGRLHEVFADTSDDASSAAGFAGLLALRLAGSGGTIVWLRQEGAQKRGGGLHAPGLAELGIDPAMLVLGILPDALSVLRVAAEMVCCPEVAVAVIELWRMPRQLDLTASRRLAVAAEASGVTALMLRVEAEPSPSAAQTRWAVASAAAAPLAANAPGMATFDIALLRQRGGSAGARWLVEWDRERGVFREAALSGAVVTLPAGGPADASGWRRAG